MVCGACRRKADKPESVVHDSDCPVYRLIRAEEANTAVMDTGTDLDGDAVVLTIGGRHRTNSGWVFDFGFSEDLQIDASPDIVFVLGVRRTF